MKHNVAVFASGTGSNAEKIITYFAERSDVTVALIVTNRENAGVLRHAETHDIPAIVISKQLLANEEHVLAKLDSFDIDFIVLAGFLLLIPKYLVQHFDQKMVNIHPALLPKYGGPGMYGKYVHRAVKNAGEHVSGITIHFVNSEYDDGQIIFQQTVELNPEDTPDEIARKVLVLEHKYFAPVIDHLLTGEDLAIILQTCN